MTEKLLSNELGFKPQYTQLWFLLGCMFYQRELCPDMTEKLLTGRLSLNTKKIQIGFGPDTTNLKTSIGKQVYRI